MLENILIIISGVWFLGAMAYLAILALAMFILPMIGYNAERKFIGTFYVTDAPTELFALLWFIAVPAQIIYAVRNWKYL
jgi:hypothetical protein